MMVIYLPVKFEFVWTQFVSHTISSKKKVKLDKITNINGSRFTQKTSTCELCPLPTIRNINSNARQDKNSVYYSVIQVRYPSSLLAFFNNIKVSS